MKAKIDQNGLTYDERTRIIPLIKRGMTFHIGKRNAVSGAKARARLKERKGITISDQTWRKYIHHICTNEPQILPGHELIAGSHGYWLSNDVAEIVEWLRSMEGRRLSMMQREKAIRARMNGQRPQNSRQMQIEMKPQTHGL